MAKKTKADLEQEIDNYKMEINRIAQESENKSHIIDSLVGKMSAFSTDNELYHQVNESLKKNVDELVEVISKLNNEIKLLTEEVDILSKENLEFKRNYVASICDNNPENEQDIDVLVSMREAIKIVDSIWSTEEPCDTEAYCYTPDIHEISKINVRYDDMIKEEVPKKKLPKRKYAFIKNSESLKKE